MQQVFSFEINIFLEIFHLNACCLVKIFVTFQTQNESIRSKKALDQ